MRKRVQYTVVIVFKNAHYEYSIFALTKKEALNKVIKQLAWDLNVTQAKIKKYTKHKFNVYVKKL